MYAKSQCRISMLHVCHIINMTCSLVIKQLALKRIQIRCVDDNMCHCFFILSDMIVDYEKQILITKMKSDQHCIVYIVSSNQRENLLQRFNCRIYWYIKKLIAHQWRIRKQKIEKQNESMYVHDHHNFAWDHHLINIHVIIQMNLLHQMLKRLINYLITWVKTLVRNTIKIFQKTKNQITIIMSKAKEIKWLNDRFRSMFKYFDLRIFNDFSFIMQWIEVQQKNVTR